MKWQLIEPFFQGARTDTFGSLTFTADENGTFEIDFMPAEPLNAIARHISGEARVKAGLQTDPLDQAAE